jgi:glycosyltransferase involved in cell wall biosynthesis
MKPTTAFIETDYCNGGGLVFLTNLAGELARRGHDWRVFSLSDVSPAPERFRQAGIATFAEKARGTIYEDRLQNLLRHLSTFRPSVVAVKIGNETAELLRYLPPGVFRLGIVHSEAQIPAAAARAQLLDCLVAVSEYNRQQLLPLVPAGTRVVKLDLGIPLPSQTAPRFRPDTAPLRILSLGSLVRLAKRVHLYPAIAERLAAAGIPFVWTIAGDGPERPWLESCLRPANPRQQIIFQGHVPHEQVPALLAAHDVFLLTSDTETFSLALHEAMASGVVPVTGDIPGRVSQMVTPDRGIRVPLEPADGYAQAILRLHADRELLRQMSAAAQAAIGQECSVESMADRWLSLLPPPPAEPPEWPAQFRLLPPLFAQNRAWQFTPPGRALRRLAARWTSR